MTLVIAHRGASAYAPENTMPAFEMAVRLTADMLELDVQQSADGVLVCFHDFTTERWDGQPRATTDCTLTELQQLDIGGARITTLAEVCAFAHETGVQLNVEIKGLGLGEDIARTLRDARIEEQVLLSSFSTVALHEIEQAATHLPRAYLMGTRTLSPGIRFRESWPFRALRRANCSAWHPVDRIPMLRRIVPRVRRAGFTVNVWTVNDVAVMERLLRVGVDGIITDVPDVLRQVMERTEHKAG